MTELVVTTLLNFVFDKVTSCIGSSWSVREELEKLQSTLLTIQAVLEDAEARQVKDKSLNVWLKKLKDVVFDADDLSDRIVIEERKIESSKIKKARHFLNSLTFGNDLARSIKEIRERLDEIAEEKSKFHLQERVVVKGSKEDIGVLREETGSFVNESEVYGREEDREKIVEFLINNMSSSSGDELGVMAIVGLGGLGKTTVSQLIYNDERVDGHFEIRMWVCVSDDSDTKKICRSIIESVRRTACNLEEMDSLQRSVIEELWGKRFLLVLDDVWDEKNINWNRLRSLLSCGAKGSKILVTTRIENVACTMGTVSPHYLAVLSEDDCWTLFEKRAFGLGGANKTPYLEAIGREIVNKCGGVPLAATALGSLMRFKKSESEWVTVKESELWELPDDENEILPALRLSYNHLPSRLKQCFAYCSIFPKDYQIKKETLVQLWIAEGFIRSSDENANLDGIGFQYVNELLSRSLLENVRWDDIDDDDIVDDDIDDGVVTRVKMHDLVHDLARSVAGEECSIVDASSGKEFFQSSGFQSSRYSSFLFSKYNKDISATLEPLNRANKLRTFHLITSAPGHETTKLLYVIFSKSKLLRALYLGRECYIFSLPNSVCNLEHLRYLHFEDALFKTLPESIGDLHNLLTLNLGYCKFLISLPSSIGRLTRLRKLNLERCYRLVQLPENTSNMRSLLHLNTRGCRALICMPAGLGQLSHLRTLPMYVLGKKNHCSLGELGGLNLLEDELEIVDLENVSNAAEARSANLREKHRLMSLKLKWNSSEPPEMPDRDRDGYVVEDVLESLQPHTNLEDLTIDGYLGRKFPSWMLESSLPNIVRISLTSSCFRCERLPPFGQLPKLKNLRLSMLPAVKCLGSDFYGGDGVFPMLETLYLESMPALEEWSRARATATATGGEIFPSLSFLSIRDCPKLKALSPTFPFLTTLEINADEGLLLSALQDGAFSNLKRLMLYNNYFGSFGKLPQVIKERMASINNWTDEHLTQLNSIPLDNSVSSDQFKWLYSSSDE